MSLAPTYFQNIRVNYPSQLDRDELRLTAFGLFEAVQSMTNSANSIVSDDLKQKATTSQGRLLQVPVMEKGIVTITNVRSCTVSCSQSNSDLIDIVWKTVVTDICSVPSQYEKNIIGKDADLGKKFNEAAEAFLLEIEEDLDAAFDANKSQVYGSTLVGTDYPLVASAIQVQDSQMDFFFNALTPINRADNFNDLNIKVIASTAMMTYVTKYINQGNANNTNTQFQYAGKDFTFSNAVTDGVAVKATGYFMPDGSLGLLTRVDVDARMRNTASNGVQWFEDTMSGLPFTVGVKYDGACSDQSTLETAGLEYLTATLVEHWQISFDYAIVAPFNSDITTKPSSIRKFEVV